MSDYQVGPETFVVISYTVHDAEGEAVGPPELKGFVFGMGQLLPRIENALEGRVEGDMLDVELEPEQAFGKRNLDAVVTIERSEFPPDAETGDRFEMENVEGDVLVVHLLEVGTDTVVVDLNHPLADQKIVVSVEVREVRPATGTELEAAEAALEEDQRFWTGEIPHVSLSGLIRPQYRG